jgi:hypothetical protein
MKKIISILVLALFAVCVTNAQEMSRSIKAGAWRKILEENVTYTIEPVGNNIIIKEGEMNLHSIVIPDSIIFSSIDATIDEGVMINGVKWATRNLAAHGKFADKPEDRGALFQWGRKGDGHEQRTSPNYPTDNTNGEEGVVSGAENFDIHGQIVKTHEAYGKFIKQMYSPRDWRDPQINTLWNAGSETVPVKTANDPCPVGWRAPTATEFESLGNGSWTNAPVHGRNFGSGTDILFLPAAGERDFRTGAVLYEGYGYYWSVTTSSNFSRSLAISSGSCFVVSRFRAYGYSVRCVAE